MRDLFIITSRCVAAILVGAWLYFYGPYDFMAPSEQIAASVETASAEVAVPESTDVSFEVLGHGSKAAGVTTRKNYALFTAEEYARIWKLTGSTEKMPTVDFSHGYVVAVFAGSRPTGGYAISVDAIADTGDSRSVSVRLEKPGVGCITTQALTSPYQIVRVPFSEASLSHVDIEKEMPCN